MSLISEIIGIVLASFAVLAFCIFIWLSVTRCPKCRGWCYGDQEECERNQEMR